MEHLEGRALGYARCVFDPKIKFSPVVLLRHKDGRDNVRPLTGAPTTDIGEHAKVYESESAIWVLYASDCISRKWKAQITEVEGRRCLGSFSSV